MRAIKEIEFLLAARAERDGRDGRAGRPANDFWPAHLGLRRHLGGRLISGRRRFVIISANHVAAREADQ